MKKLYVPLLLLFVCFTSRAQWSDNTTDNTPVAVVNSSDIQVSNTNDGRTWIAFYSQRGSNYDMRAQLLDASGNRLLGDSGVLVSNKTSGSATYVFNVCVDGDNNFIIAFQLQVGSNYECVMQKVSPAGKLLWGPGVDLGPGLSPYPVALSTNEVAVAWNDNGKIDYQKVSASGVAAFSPYKQFTGNSNHSVSRAQLLANSNGGFSMVYQDQVSFPFYTNLFEQRFDNGGNAVWSAAIKVSTLTTASYRYYDVLIDHDTSYVGYYGNPSGKNRFDAYVQRVNPDGGLPWGTNGSSFADYSSDSDPSEQTIYIAKADGAPDIWAVCTVTNSLQTASGVYAQRFNSVSGNRYLGTLAKAVSPISDRLISLAYSRLSLCGDAPVFLATDNTNQLVAVKLNHNGGYGWADRYVVLGSTTNSKFRYGFTAVYKGQAVAVWQEDKGQGDRPFAQNITCDGRTGNPGAVSAVKADPAIAIRNLYPNPVQSQLNAAIRATFSGQVHVYVTDASGNVRIVSNLQVLRGDTPLQLNVSALPPGTYFLKIAGGDHAAAAVLFQKR